MKPVNLAIVGATGVVGQTMLQILAQRHLPIKQLTLLASARSAGKKIHFQQQTLIVAELDKFDFTDTDIALFSAGGNVSADHAPRAAAAGCIVIDNTSHFRYDDDVPLIIPEVNPELLPQYKKRRIIANPNCSTIQLLVALKPIYDAVGIKRINICTYQAVSGSGTATITELKQQINAWHNNETMTCAIYRKPIAFNVIPQIDVLQNNGYSKEEMKIVLETQKIFNDRNIKINPTAVRVPVIYGHSEAVHIETAKKISASEATVLLAEAPGVKLIADPQDYPTALTDAAMTDPVYIGRVRSDISHPYGLNLWIVADNLRKGAALNAIQIAELLLAMI